MQLNRQQKILLRKIVLKKEDWVLDRRTKSMMKMKSFCLIVLKQKQQHMVEDKIQYFILTMQFANQKILSTTIEFLRANT